MTKGLLKFSYATPWCCCLHVRFVWPRGLLGFKPALPPHASTRSNSSPQRHKQMQVADMTSLTALVSNSLPTLPGLRALHAP